MTENEISKLVLGTAFKLHSSIGPGLLEHAYKECLFYDLCETGLKVEKEKPLPLIYKQVRLDCGFRMDLVVENKLILEIKAVEALNDVHFAQLLTYLKIANHKLGLLLNFNVVHLKHGIKRIVNNL